MKSFEKIYEQNYSMMYRVAVKMIGDTDVVHDIVQEVFVAFYERSKKLDAILNCSAWLYKATYFKCIDYKKGKDRFYKLEAVADSSDDEESYNKLEEKELVRKALGRLEPKVRFMVILYSEGLSYKEMAEACEMPLSSVGKTLSRALKKLEKEFKKECYEMF